MHLPFRSTGLVLLKSSGDYTAVVFEKLLELLLSSFRVHVLDEDVGELSTLLLHLGLTLLLADVMTDIYLFVVQKHTVDSGDGSIGSFAGRVVDKGKAARLAILISANFAREDITKSGKGVVKSLIIELSDKLFKSRDYSPCCQCSRRDS